MKRWRAWIAALGADRVIAALLGVLAFALYRQTLAPSVLDGDSALFQYLPYALGVPYPTGYPIYLLLGKLWVSLVAVGDVAYRMNLLSAFLGAVAVGLIYLLIHELVERRPAALVSALYFATLPTYWRWATVTKIYMLHVFLFSAMLYLLLRWRAQPERNHRLLYVVAFLYGLSLGNHSTTVLLAPALFLFVWLHGLRDWRRLLKLAPLVLAPALLYLYVPLRAEYLLARYGAMDGLTMPVATAQGIVSDFYRPGWGGLLRYFTAADFTGGVVRDWQLLPAQFVSVYLPLARDDFGSVGLLLALIGGAYLAWRRPRLFLPLFAVPFCLIPFVLRYGQGEQSAFLLPVDLVLSAWIGAALAWGGSLLRRNLPLRVLELLLLAAFCLALPLQQMERNLLWLAQKWKDAPRTYWEEVLAHPLEQQAGLLAHWGDLTTFWYLQQAEGNRPDLIGLFPPDEKVVIPWLEAGRPLYIAGPLQGWAQGVNERYSLVSWGRLVRVQSRSTSAQEALPRPSRPLEAAFGNRLQLRGFDLAAEAPSGGLLPLTLYWHSLEQIDLDTNISLRLLDEKGEVVEQMDDRLLSAWYPQAYLPPGQPVLGVYRLRVPPGTLPGNYHLDLSVYANRKDAWPTGEGKHQLELSSLRVALPPPGTPLEIERMRLLPGVTFSGEMALPAYRYSTERVRQGKDFYVELLWQATSTPAGDYTVLVRAVDGAGQVWAESRQKPVNGAYPTTSWRAEQAVRERHGLSLPADAPPGVESLRVHVALLDGAGRPLPVWQDWRPLGGEFILGPIEVSEKERLFSAPPLDVTLGADLGGLVTLLGCNRPPDLLHPGDTFTLKLAWQGQALMDRRYTVFVHLLDEEGAIRAQRDREPGNGDQPTTGWLPGEVVLDEQKVSLPGDLPPGEYRLIAGMYRAETGERLPVLNGAGEDYVLLGSVSVR